MKRICFYFRKFKRTGKSCSLAMRDNSCLSLRVNENVGAENGPYGWTEFLCIQWFKHRGYKQWRYKQRVVRKFDDKKVNDFKIKLNTNSIDCRVLECYFRPNADFLSGLTPLILGFLQRFTTFRKIKNQTEMVINWTGHIMHE